MKEDHVKDVISPRTGKPGDQETLLQLGLRGTCEDLVAEPWRLEPKKLQEDPPHEHTTCGKRSHS